MTVPAPPGARPTPAELAQEHAELSPRELDHLQRLLASWGVLADLSFSDLLLMVPARAPASLPEAAVTPELVVLGQMRPNNCPTLVEQDLVGQSVRATDWAFTVAALQRGETVRGGVPHPSTGEQMLVESVPVRYRDRVVAALVRVSAAASARPSSSYVRTYLRLFERLSVMVAESTFPFPGDDASTEDTPRVGDGVVVVNRDGRVEFASPNAMNAFHRMGVFSQLDGQRFTELGVEESAVEWALATGRPVVEEVERRPDVIVLVHCLPFLAAGEVTGAMILLRDVTDVRRLDRLLLSKDAAIREVHHRVKNNLQTISSLLSLQARRVAVGAGRVALREAERRVRSIALVHEILSRDPGDQVPFSEIVVSLVQMAEDSVISTHPVEIMVSGDLGEVSAGIATPLAVTLAELLQNAVEHAFVPDPTRVSESPDDEPLAPVDGRTRNPWEESSPWGGRHEEAPSGVAAYLGAAAPGGAPAPGTVGGDQAVAEAPAPAPAAMASRDQDAGGTGHVWLTLSIEDGTLCVEVLDDGCGLPEGFQIEETTSLGLSIVRDLVESQLGGTITMATVPPAEGGGTRARITLPATGTAPA